MGIGELLWRIPLLWVLKNADPLQACLRSPAFLLLALHGLAWNPWRKVPRFCCAVGRAKDALL